MRAHSTATIVRGILTASLALLCLVAEVGTVAHVILVRHAVCAEHGEIVHTSHGAAPAAHDAPWVSPAARSFPAHDAADAHEHCGATCGRSSFGPPEGYAHTVPVDDDATRARPPRSLEARPAISLLLIAPKSSPPV